MHVCAACAPRCARACQVLARRLLVCECVPCVRVRRRAEALQKQLEAAQAALTEAQVARDAASVNAEEALVRRGREGGALS